jgi:photosystem II stability/assembly factor-like uncharacterized protein
MNRRLRSALFILVLALLALPAFAGVGVWTSLGPDGGPIFGLAVAPDDPDILYAGSLAGVFKSTDDGATWALASRGLFLQSAAVYQNAVAPGGVLYVSTGIGVFKTTDGAQTWVPVSAGLPGPAQTLAVDPRTPQRVWAGIGRGRIYLSTDGGATWSLRKKGLPNGPVTQLAVSADGAWVFAATSRGFYRSSDQGLSWLPTTGFRKQARINELVIDAEDPATLYAATTGGLYRSRNRGATWNRIAKNVFPLSVYLITIQGGRLYAAVFDQGIFLSTDGGTTWAPVQEQPEDTRFTALTASPEAVFAGTIGAGHPGGVYRSLDHGMSWEASRHGLAALLVSAVAVDPSNPDVLFAAAGNAGAFRSVDRGNTWEHLNLDIGEILFFYASDVLVDPSNPSDVYVSNVSGATFHRSEDGGDTWQEIAAPPFFQLAADRRTPGALWATGYDAVYHSANRGTTWVRVPLPESLSFRELGDIEVSPSDPPAAEVLWVAGAVFGEDDGRLLPRLYRSADAGRTWERRDHGLVGQAVASLALDPAAPDTLYAATDFGLFRSTDAGRTWTLRPPLVGKVTQVVTTPTAVYAFLTGFGVMRSTDQGNTWSPARRDLGAVLVLDLTVDPTDPRRLYAATATRGLFEYTQP